MSTEITSSDLCFKRSFWLAVEFKIEGRWAGRRLEGYFSMQVRWEGGMGPGGAMRVLESEAAPQGM